MNKTTLTWPSSYDDDPANQPGMAAVDPVPAPFPYCDVPIGSEMFLSSQTKGGAGALRTPNQRATERAFHLGSTTDIEASLSYDLR